MTDSKTPTARQGPGITIRFRPPVRARLEERAAAHARSLAGEMEALLDLALYVDRRVANDPIFEAAVTGASAVRAAEALMPARPASTGRLGVRVAGALVDVRDRRPGVAMATARQVLAAAADDRSANVDLARQVMLRLLTVTQGFVRPDARGEPTPIGAAWGLLSEVLTDPALGDVLGREAAAVGDAVELLAQALQDAVDGGPALDPFARDVLIGSPGFSVRPWTALQGLAAIVLGASLDDLCASYLLDVAEAHALGGRAEFPRTGWGRARHLRTLALDLAEGLDPPPKLARALAAVDALADAVSVLSIGKPLPEPLALLVKGSPARVRAHIEGLVALIARCAPHVARETEADAQAAAPEA